MDLPNIKDVKYIIAMDGDSWMAVREDFTNLQESPAGFGPTPGEALDALFRENDE